MIHLCMYSYAELDLNISYWFSLRILICISYPFSSNLTAFIIRIEKKNFFKCLKHPLNRLPKPDINEQIFYGPLEYHFSFRHRI